MTLKSMTGFSRADGTLGPMRWHWEVRSVNGRGLDVRLRLPPGLDMLEPRIREAVAKRMARGSVSLALTLMRETGATEIRLNEAALRQVVHAAEVARAMVGGGAPQVEGLLALKGVLEVVEPEEGDTEALRAALLASLETALDGVVAARVAEGRRLADVLLAHLGAIEQQVAIASAAPSRTVEAVRRRLQEQVARLTETGTQLDPARLHQEAVLIATRIDIEEEIRRLTAHLAAARDLIAADEAVGRKLDFLAQELNREANTLCSKANDPEITRAGLTMKSVIDQWREQVQNIE